MRVNFCERLLQYKYKLYLKYKLNFILSANWKISLLIFRKKKFHVRWKMNTIFWWVNCNLTCILSGVYCFFECIVFEIFDAKQNKFTTKSTSQYFSFILFDYFIVPKMFIYSWHNAYSASVVNSSVVPHSVVTVSDALLSIYSWISACNSDRSISPF